MYKKELIEHLAQRSGKSQAEAGDFLKNFIDVVSETLEAGEDVQILGFGTFRLQNREERQGRNPHTGAPMTIPAARKVNFKPSASLSERINK